MSDELADLSPARLLRHVKNLQSQLNALYMIIAEMKATTRRCCYCKLTKRKDEFHETGEKEMPDTEVKQMCICSLELALECPAHPFRQRRQRVRPSGEAIRRAPCPACVALGESEHSRAGEHALDGYREVAAALAVGSVFCTLPQLDKKAKFVVRGVRRADGGGLEVEVLEGWFAPTGKVWMKARRKAA